MSSKCKLLLEAAPEIPPYEKRVGWAIRQVRRPIVRLDLPPRFLVCPIRNLKELFANTRKTDVLNSPKRAVVDGDRTFLNASC